MKKKLDAVPENYGRQAHARLDAWGRGFMVGVLTGGVLAIGVLWAIMEPLR